jgi:hypothetical protein
MNYPTFMRMPFFPWGNGEAIQLAFGICELDPIPRREVAWRSGP